MIIRNFLHSARILAGSCLTFLEFAVEGLKATRERIEELVGRSLMFVTAVSPKVEHEKAAEMRRVAQGRSTMKEAALELGYLTESEYYDLVLPGKTTSLRDLLMSALEDATLPKQATTKLARVSIDSAARPRDREPTQLLAPSDDQ